MTYDFTFSLNLYITVHLFFASQVKLEQMREEKMSSGQERGDGLMHLRLFFILNWKLFVGEGQNMDSGLKHGWWRRKQGEASKRKLVGILGCPRW